MTKRTLIALAIALVLLVVAILPAEYGVDPTGLGGLFGFAKLAAGNETRPPPNATVEYRYQAVWPIQATEPSPIEGYTKERTTRQVEVPVGSDNVTRLVATLTWSDDNETGGQRTQPDVFELQVIGRDGTRGTAVLGRNDASGKGNITAELAWRAPPEPRTITAPGPEDAVDQARRLEPTDPSGRGPWTINVTIVDAGDAEAAGVPVAGAAGDQGNDWRLSIRVESFFLDEQRLTAFAVREDLARITVPPGRGLEYKFRIAEGNVMEYSWSANESLYYDFHGEREGDKSGAFTSHSSGTAKRAEGTFVAPFTGTHGWYWQNNGRTELVVELTTTGVYEIVGQR
ncbi:MAG: hypothetical protein HYT80_02380 [Euryarchaeota archaeon]|nr:hypothetical protein [Euryarchaeota archaeon]